MRRFVYTPDVHAYVATQEAGIIDISEDIVRGSVTRNRDQASSANLILQNPWRKYLRKFKPMDRISIYLTRVKPMLVFTGYLDRAPVDQLYPGTVTIDATCTLKRLLHTYWDPSLPYVMRFFQQNGWTLDPTTGNVYSGNQKTLFNFDINGSIGHVMRAVLSEVGGWPVGAKGTNNTVHILGLPQGFMQKTQDMVASAVAQNDANTANIQQFINNMLTVNGLFSTPFNPTKDSYSATSDSNADSNPLPAIYAGSYPATIYGPHLTIGQMPPDNTPWEKAILFYLGAPATPDNIRVLNAWATQEGGWTYNNPMNTSLLAHTSGIEMQPNGNFAHYANPSFGIAMTASTLLESYYPFIVAAFQSGQASTIFTNADAQKEIGTWGTNLANFQTDYATASSTTSSPNLNFIQSEALSAAQALGTAGMSQMPGGNNATKTNSASDPNVTGSIGDVKVGPEFFNKVYGPPSPGQPNPAASLASSGFTFQIKGNPYKDDSLIFKIIGIETKVKGISIYVPGADGSSPQGKNWTNQKVTLETSINQASRFGTSGSQTTQTNPAQASSTDLIHGGTGSPAILSPVAKQALSLIQQSFGPFILAKSTKDTINLVPCDSNNNPDWSPAGVGRAQAAAQWAGWIPNNNGQPSASNPTVKYIGWRTEQTGTIDLPKGIGTGTTGFVFYDQGDPRWSNHPIYNGSTIGPSGCGPTSAAMVISTLTGQVVTPIDTGDYMTQIGGFVAGQGASSQGLIDVCIHYGLKAQGLGLNWSEAENVLQNQGGLVIAQGNGPSPYTSAGHVVVLKSFNSGNFLIGNSAPFIPNGSGPFTAPISGTINLIGVTK